MRALFSIVYLAAAGVQYWPLLMLSMSSAFGGLKENSFLFIFLFVSLIVSMLLLAIGAGAALAKKQKFYPLLISGPLLGVFMTILMALTVFRQSSIFLSVPQGLFSGGALFLGISAFRDRELLRG
jgi:hypothetical protein